MKDVNGRHLGAKKLGYFTISWYILKLTNMPNETAIVVNKQQKSPSDFFL
jgi:hypothetical protein